MRIDNSNGHMIDSNEIVVHDDIFGDMVFNRVTDELRVILTKAQNRESTYEIKFANVVGVSLTACNFWGKSPHILDFEYIEPNDQKILPNLECIRKEQHPSCKLKSDTRYIETVMTFISGDTLRVACEYIIFDQ